MRLTNEQKEAVRRLLALTETKQFALSSLSGLSPSVVSEMTNLGRERDIQPDTWRKFVAGLERVVADFKAKGPPEQVRAEVERLLSEATQEEVKPILEAGDFLQDPGGWIASNARNYIERNIDRQLTRYLDRNMGAMITIQGPAQSGRSSVVRHLVDQALQRGFAADLVDFQEFADLHKGDGWTADQAARWVMEQLGITPPKVTFTKGDFAIEAGLALLRGLEARTLKVRRAFLIFDSFDVLAKTVVEAAEEDLLAKWLTVLRNALPTQPPFDRMTLVVVASPPQWAVDSIMSDTLSHGRGVVTTKFSDEEVRELFDAYDLGGEEHKAARGYALNDLAGHPFLTHVLASELAFGESLATIQRMAAEVEPPFENHWAALWRRTCQFFRDRKEVEARAAQLLRTAVKLADGRAKNDISVGEFRFLKAVGILDNGDNSQMCGFYRQAIRQRTSQFSEDREP